MDDINTTLPALNAPDILTPLFGKIFAQMGQDTNSPAVQEQISGSIKRLRETNPDLSDADIAKNVQTNLPQVITSIAQTKPSGLTVDPQKQYDDLQAQRQKDVQSARDREFTAPMVWGKNPAINPVEFGKQQNELAYAPSNALQAGIKDAGDIYKNESLQAIADSDKQKATQEGLKTGQAQREAVTQQQLVDKDSLPSQTLRASLSQQLKAMGVPDQVLNNLNQMNFVQMTAYSQQFVKTAKDKADIDLVVQQSLTQKSSQAANYASANSSNASAGASRAQADMTRAQTQGVQYDNVTKKRIADGVQSGDYSNLPPDVLRQTMGDKAYSNYQDNKEALKNMNAGGSSVINTRTKIDEINHILNSGQYTGIGADRFKAIDAGVQALAKSFGGVQSSQQAGSNGTGAAGAAISSAVPTANSKPEVIRQWLSDQMAQISRYELVQEQLANPKIDPNFNRFSYESKLIPISVLQGNRIVRVDAYEPGEVQGAMAALQKKYPGAVVAPTNTIKLSTLGR